MVDNKNEILRYSTCKYINDGRHIILKGASGNGKTYIACALGNAACRRMKTVRYVRKPEILDELNVARVNGEFAKVIKGYKKVELLIIDEWLIRRLTPQESYDMLELSEARSRKSMIFCTQYESEGWYERINSNPEGDSPVSEAIMDRIINNAYIMTIDGKMSMRDVTVFKIQRRRLIMNDYCTFSRNHKCLKWTDYELTRYEFEEADELCQRNQAEIQKLNDHIELLHSLLDQNGIDYPAI